MGTAKYLSPEQVLGLPRRQPRRPLLARRPALRVPRRPAAVPRRHARRPPPWPGCSATRCPCASSVPGVPRALDDLVMRAAGPRRRRPSPQRRPRARRADAPARSGRRRGLHRGGARATAPRRPGWRCRRASGRRRRTTPRTRAAWWRSARPAATWCRSSCCASSPPCSPWPARCSSRPAPAPAWSARRATPSRASRRPPRRRRPRVPHRPRRVVVSSGEFDPPPGGDGRENPERARRPDRRPPGHGVVDGLLQRPQPRPESGRRSRVPALGTGERPHPRRHLPDDGRVGRAGVRERQHARHARRLGFARRVRPRRPPPARRSSPSAPPTGATCCCSSPPSATACRRASVPGSCRSPRSR